MLFCLQAIPFLLIVHTYADRRMVAYLEGRFPMLPLDTVGVDGIIMLGGTEAVALSKKMKEPMFTEGGRILKTAMLAIQYPNATIILSGGVPDNDPTISSEAEISLEALKRLNVPNLDSRIILETVSHTTYENVLYSMKKVNVTKDQQWVVVTSATHMARSIGIFRKLGWNSSILAAPSSHYTSGIVRPLSFTFRPDVTEVTKKLDVAFREYMALVFYYFKGYTDELFPSPIIEAKQDAHRQNVDHCSTPLVPCTSTVDK